MSHILEAAQAEHARAAAGGGVYHFGAPSGGGYAFADSPVIVSSVKAPAETDAQRADRLAREVGRLTYELAQAKRELFTAYNGDARAARKFDGTPVAIVLDGVSMTVAVWCDDADPDSDRFVTSVWTGHDWMCQDDLTDDFRRRAMDAVLAEENAA
jgi:hypothetical protein